MNLSDFDEPLTFLAPLAYQNVDLSQTWVDVAQAEQLIKGLLSSFKSNQSVLGLATEPQVPVL